jgi:hypothetical protein
MTVQKPILSFYIFKPPGQIFNFGGLDVYNGERTRLLNSIPAYLRRAERRISALFRNQLNNDIGNDEYTDSELRVRIRGLNRGDQVIITKRYEDNTLVTEPAVTIGGSSLFGEIYEIDLIATEINHQEHTAGAGKGFVRQVNIQVISAAASNNRIRVRGTQKTKFQLTGVKKHISKRKRN